MLVASDPALLKQGMGTDTEVMVILIFLTTVGRVANRLGEQGSTLPL